MTGHTSKSLKVVSITALNTSHLQELEKLYKVVVSSLTSKQMQFIVEPHPDTLLSIAKGAGILLGAREKETQTLVGGAVIGYPSTEASKTGLASTPDMDASLYSVLRGILVHPSHKGKGIGNKLMHEWFAQSTKKKRYTLWTEVVRTNPISLSMMINNGFNIESEAIHPYDQAEVFLLRKNLRQQQSPSKIEL